MPTVVWVQYDNVGDPSATFTTLNWGTLAAGSRLGVQACFVVDSDIMYQRLWVSDATTDNSTPASWITGTSNAFRASMYDYGSSSWSGAQVDMNTSATTADANMYYLSSTDPGAGAPNINGGTQIDSGTNWYLLLGIFPTADVAVGAHSDVTYTLSFSYS